MCKSAHTKKAKSSEEDHKGRVTKEEHHKEEKGHKPKNEETEHVTPQQKEEKENKEAFDKAEETYETEGRRFIAINVESDSKISDLVRDLDLHFREGHGYYEFTKKEKIQKYKEFLVIDKKGALHVGRGARALFDLPDDEDVEVEAEKFENYTCFVQSSSNNRKLIGGTKFLYEVDDLGPKRK
ncbi:hypothetical protein PROFUN_00824 [Planoprotostelium fungivorum]|uniref:Uncharacterized protein n=1 Tax=Planoprotostelium fungivorum TaxID=1890364 RepID=A0A2P6P043_9EUKA|nr:hypothetical protein PROFUN_00824 [Planoprotostelium fungivorum]